VAWNDNLQGALEVLVLKTLELPIRWRRANPDYNTCCSFPALSAAIGSIAEVEKVQVDIVREFAHSPIDIYRSCQCQGMKIFRERWNCWC